MSARQEAVGRWVLLEVDYQKKVLEAGRSIHRKAGVPKLLKDLAEIIRPDYPNIKIEEKVVDNGKVSLGIKWNFRDALEGSQMKHVYNSVNIVAYPLTQELAFMGEDEFVVLNKSQWSFDPKLLEDAIERAYRNPMQVFTPQGRDIVVKIEL